VSIRGTLDACTVGSGKTIDVYGNLSFRNTSGEIYIKYPSNSDHETIINYYAIQGKWNSIDVYFLSPALTNGSILYGMIPSTATSNNSPGISITSNAYNRAAALFSNQNASATVPTVYIQNANSSIEALRVNGSIVIASNGVIGFYNMSKYLHTVGTDIYWWDGTTDTKLN
jgi:hypothetical protein